MEKGNFSFSLGVGERNFFSSPEVPCSTFLVDSALGLLITMTGDFGLSFFPEDILILDLELGRLGLKSVSESASFCGQSGQFISGMELGVLFLL